MVYPAFLTLPDDQCVPVVYKVLIDTAQALAKCEQEARVLQELEGVAGVPKLYGATNIQPHAIVMSFRPGVMLLKYLRPDTLRIYLTCLKEACHVLTRLHERGVTHRDLHGANILVEVAGDTEVVSVSLVDFGDALVGGGAKNEFGDVRAMTRMAMQSPLCAARRFRILLSTRRFLVPDGEGVGLREVCVVLCGLIQGHSVDGPPCSLCLLSCFANN